MPCVPSSHWLATINPPTTWDGKCDMESLKSFQDYFLEKCERLISSLEIGGKGKSHFHCAFKLRSPERGDNLKRRLRNYFNFGKSRYAIKLSPTRGADKDSELLTAVAYVAKDGNYYNHGFDDKMIQRAVIRNETYNRAVSRIMWCNRRLFAENLAALILEEPDKPKSWYYISLYRRGFVPLNLKDDDLYLALREAVGVQRNEVYDEFNHLL